MAVNLKQLSEIPERLIGGHRLCAGCGASIAVRQVFLGTADPIVAGCATGCLEVATTIFPYTAWNTPFIHNAFENVAATMSGVETAYRALKKRGKIKKEIKFVAFGGDGGTYDIGLQSLSGMLERGHRVVYVCLPPDEELLLKNGEIIPIGEFAEKYIKENIEMQKLVNKCEYIIREKAGEYTSLSGSVRTTTLLCVEESSSPSDIISAPADNEVISWDGAKFRPSKIIRVQRKKSPKDLVKITTKSGSVLKLTREHKILVDTIDGPVWKPAETLDMGDELYTPRKIHIDQAPIPDIFDCINNELYVLLPDTIRSKINNIITKNFGTIKKASELLKLKYWQFIEKKRPINIMDLKKILKYTTQSLRNAIKNKIVRITSKGGSVAFGTKELNTDILYLLGLISSDGSISRERYRIDFVNKEKVLIKNFIQLYKKHFRGSICKTLDRSGVTYLAVSDPILYSLAGYFDVKEDPKAILKMPPDFVSAYIKGVFDGDGHASILHNKYSHNGTIIITTTKEKLAKRLRLMLQRLGIACFQDKRKHRFDLTITSRIDIKRFIQSIGCNHPYKRANLHKIEKLWKTIPERGGYFSLAPKKCSKLLANFCKENKIPISKFDKKYNLMTAATGKRRMTKNKVKMYLDIINTYSYSNDLNKEIHDLITLDYFIDPIRSIEYITSYSEYVYDITVDTTHCFIPVGGSIISNCYDNEGYMNTGIQRSSATPQCANTTTAPAGKVIPGKPEMPKDLTAIVAAHNIPYTAQASISHWHDLITKAQKAFAADGPAFLNVFSPCHRGWRMEMSDTVAVAKLAVDTGFWPLYEIENGKWKLTYKPRERKPLIEYIKTQGRFKHLLTPESQPIIDNIQKSLDEYWTTLEKRCAV